MKKTTVTYVLTFQMDQGNTKTTTSYSQEWGLNQDRPTWMKWMVHCEKLFKEAYDTKNCVIIHSNVIES